MTAFNLIKSLTKRGNVVLGAGCYAAAISSRDRNQVIKIGNSMNDPWLDYYHGIIKTNQANPHVPKIKHFMCEESHSYYICVMERLDEEEPGVYKAKIAELCKDYITLMNTREEFVDMAKKYPAAIPCPDLLANLLDKIREDTEVFEYGCEEASETARRLDMHSGNFLFRDGVIVVTDPWCENDTSDLVDVSDWLAKRYGNTTSASW
jgi:hypothetical protein